MGWEKMLYCTGCGKETEHETNNSVTAATTYWACIECGDVTTEDD